MIIKNILRPRVCPCQGSLVRGALSEMQFGSNGVSAEGFPFSLVLGSIQNVRGEFDPQAKMVRASCFPLFSSRNWS